MILEDYDNVKSEGGLYSSEGMSTYLFSKASTWEIQQNEGEYIIQVHCTTSQWAIKWES